MTPTPAAPAVIETSPPDPTTPGGAAAAGPAPRPHGGLSLVEMLRVMSDKTRLRILLLLAAGERNVGSLCKATGMQQATVNHLSLLRASRLVLNRQDGKRVIYALSATVPAGAEPSLLLRVPAGDAALTLGHRGPASRITAAP